MDNNTDPSIAMISQLIRAFSTDSASVLLADDANKWKHRGKHREKSYTGSRGSILTTTDANGLGLGRLFPLLSLSSSWLTLYFVLRFIIPSSCYRFVELKFDKGPNATMDDDDDSLFCVKYKGNLFELSLSTKSYSVTADLLLVAISNTSNASASKQVRRPEWRR